jgi:hypothetical protein
MAPTAEKKPAAVKTASPAAKTASPAAKKPASASPVKKVGSACMQLLSRSLLIRAIAKVPAPCPSELMRWPMRPCNPSLCTLLPSRLPASPSVSSLRCAPTLCQAVPAATSSLAKGKATVSTTASPAKKPTGARPGQPKASPAKAGAKKSTSDAPAALAPAVQEPQIDTEEQARLKAECVPSFMSLLTFPVPKGCVTHRLQLR